MYRTRTDPPGARGVPLEVRPAGHAGCRRNGPPAPSAAPAGRWGARRPRWRAVVLPAPVLGLTCVYDPGLSREVRARRFHPRGLPLGAPTPPQDAGVSRAAAVVAEVDEFSLVLRAVRDLDQAFLSGGFTADPWGSLTLFGSIFGMFGLVPLRVSGTCGFCGLALGRVLPAIAPLPLDPEQLQCPNIGTL